MTDTEKKRPDYAEEARRLYVRMASLLSEEEGTERFRAVLQAADAAGYARCQKRASKRERRLKVYRDGDAAGYRRGLEDAAAEVGRALETGECMGLEAMSRLGPFSMARDIRRAIRARIDQDEVKG